ncbi:MULTISPECIES: hypothetical protein [Candidatus Ichthyocystis]|nr:MULTISPECIES: hypothetical protein [Ichthyocystis]
MENGFLLIIEEVVVSIFRPPFFLGVAFGERGISILRCELFAVVEVCVRF